MKNLKLEELHLYEIQGLNAELELVKKSAVKNGRKKFWKGFTIGVVTVGIVGTATTIYLITK